MRYFLQISYNGTRYNGWQTQPNARAVQQVLDESLHTIFQTEINTVGSGRTDTGVHASEQFVHLDLPFQISSEETAFRLNKILPKDISLNKILEVGPQAHARFDAISRTYEYRICLQKNPFLADFAYYLSRKPDVEEMNEAAKMLLGFQDFTAFSKVKGDTKHYNCHIYEANWKQEQELLIFTIKANRFLRGMVRLIVGTLLSVGKGKISVSAFGKIIESQDRSKASGAAPAEGLFLTKVEYPEGYFDEQKKLFYSHLNVLPGGGS
ncbi:tRNA pseudouridine(38-40) synthase TruA [Adhaeribacter sp. BT258]|uniref:tRNA pseudouridine synthase A n=1 Tax=Adhaeribacter terrigena TaxID=2793070 RepID=A0ABS1C230_9BACT|nr:tRNA pseudouridine(38-40) synthase TruA [Adhaeribacter terrigena]MBK0403442.1 tRNA pseudouridine(38-40) synthase TruA [Adhaeribacter terrigena]